MKAVKRRASRKFEGLPVIDSPTALQLHILPQDVKGANKKDPAHCAAAKAGQRELKRDVRVFLTRTYVKEKKHWIRYMTPESVSREIISFDRGSSFQPGTYRLRAPSASMQLGVYRGKNSHPEGGGHRKRAHHVTGLVRTKAAYDPPEKS